MYSLQTGGAIYTITTSYTVHLSVKRLILRVCKEVVSKVNTVFPKKRGIIGQKTLQTRDKTVIKYIKKDQNILLKFHKAMIPVYVD